MRRSRAASLGFNLLTGIVLGIGGWYVGWFAGAR